MSVTTGAAGAATLGVTNTVRGASCTTGTGLAIVSSAAEFGWVLDTPASAAGPGR
jgi:hypothetical protein